MLRQSIYLCQTIHLNHSFSSSTAAFFFHFAPFRFQNFPYFKDENLKERKEQKKEKCLHASIW